ncbi:dolichyl-phosphate-mannose--protein mannosyltransferase [Motilibacter rhizosphaerae]|uniref:dolichyl-phosphate-mannose--protein mannosyltransferase n=1 Tax=Motilibacter rhizosphaerae TaxID=598652 RepID=UPI0013EEBFB4|nr:phospholipid carrier-dependent glycosyltransferase [Motilibacter rhizosphaerae]
MATTLIPAAHVRADRGPRSRGFSAAARERLVTAMPSDRLLGWVGPLLVGLLGGLLRFYHLGDPGTGWIFDEKYYAQEAQSYLHNHVEYAVPYDGPVSDPAPNFVVHPPIGKWVIALGEKVGGYHPGVDGFGWRLSVALLGTLGIVLLARIGRRLFRSTLLGCVAGLLLCLDGLHLVESRTALLDPVLTFWVLCAFGCVVVDRDWTRRRLARRLDEGGDGRAGLGLRPWLLAAGLFSGLACGTKWNGVFFIVAFGLLALAWTIGARRVAGADSPWLSTLVRDVPLIAVYLLLVPLAVYLASWTGWFLSDDAHACFRDWANATQPAVYHAGGGVACTDNWGPGNKDRYPLLPFEALKELWYYHHQMWDFNVHLHTPHLYQSNPWSWLLLGRPVAFWFPTGTAAPTDCGADKCAAAITALGTPALWWAVIPALVVLGYRALGRLDWRAAAILVPLLAGYLPWFNYQERTIFSFYAVVFAPFAALAVAYCVGLVLGPPDASGTRRTWGAAVAGAYLLLVAADFAYLWPILTAQHIPYQDWYARMWFKSWI